MYFEANENHKSQKRGELSEMNVYKKNVCISEKVLLIKNNYL